jgi:Predicted hydrolase (metallo-beta-lactamase superfamily)
VLDIDDEPDVKILVLSPTKAYLKEEKPTDRDIHDQCVVLRVEYNGKSILFTGDSSMEAWKERIVPYYSDESGRPNLLDSTILHVSHHGSYTFYKPKGKSKDEAYTDAIEKIDPEIAIISVGKDNRHGHPDEDALALYNKYTFNGQVYMAMDHGTIFLQIDEDGNYTIETETMRNSSKLLTIGAVKIVTTPSPNEDDLYDIGVELTFKAKITKMPSDQTIKNLKWIVQNNAVGDDKHHDWYVRQYKNSRTYENQTAYSGSHTLLCEVRNQRGRIVATKAIKVNVK